MATTTVKKKQLETMSVGTVYGNNGTAVQSPIEVVVPMLIASGNFAAVANGTIDFGTVNIANFKRLKVFLSAVQPVTDGTNLLMRVSTDNITFPVAAGTYGWGYHYTQFAGSDGVVFLASDTDIHIVNTVSNLASSSLELELTIFNPGLSTYKPKYIWQSVLQGTAGAGYGITGFGGVLAAQTTRAIRFLFSSGNIANMNYAVYAYKN